MKQLTPELRKAFVYGLVAFAGVILLVLFKGELVGFFASIAGISVSDILVIMAVFGFLWPGQGWSLKSSIFIIFGALVFKAFTAIDIVGKPAAAILVILIATVLSPVVDGWLKNFTAMELIARIGRRVNKQ